MRDGAACLGAGDRTFRLVGNPAVIALVATLATSTMGNVAQMLNELSNDRRLQELDAPGVGGGLGDLDGGVTGESDEVADQGMIDDALKAAVTSRVLCLSSSGS